MPKPSTVTARREIVGRMFPNGLPALWCPTLTHFLRDGALDVPRIRRHLQFIAPHVKGILVPGSTGEGWEMNDAEVRELVPVVLDAASELGIKVLVGVLKVRADEAIVTMTDTVAWARRRTGRTSDLDALVAAGIVGFTVCPPRGRDLTQDQIATALGEMLGCGYPMAVYQLPQVTENEVHPESLAALAAQYPNLYLFKDTSGGDRVALSGVDLGGVFLVRGAEGEYSRWLRSAGGPYDGFLLSTANGFARQLAEIVHLCRTGRTAEAASLSARLDRAIQGCFQSVAGFHAGNPFTNANKAFDHIFAYATAALDQPPPVLHSGVELPRPFIERACDLLRAEGLLPERGYNE